MTRYDMRISDWSSGVCSSDLDQRQHTVRAADTQHIFAPRSRNAADLDFAGGDHERLAPFGITREDFGTAGMMLDARDRGEPCQRAVIPIGEGRAKTQRGKAGIAVPA